MSLRGSQGRARSGVLCPRDRLCASVRQRADLRRSASFPWRHRPVPAADRLPAMELTANRSPPRWTTTRTQGSAIDQTPDVRAGACRANRRHGAGARAALPPQRSPPAARPRRSEDSPLPVPAEGVSGQDRIHGARHVPILALPVPGRLRRDDPAPGSTTCRWPSASQPSGANAAASIATPSVTRVTKSRPCKGPDRVRAHGPGLAP